MAAALQKGVGRVGRVCICICMHYVRACIGHLWVLRCAPAACCRRTLQAVWGPREGLPPPGSVCFLLCFLLVGGQRPKGSW